MIQEDKFSTFVPIEFYKGEVTDKSGKKRKMLFKGTASNSNTGKDMDGEHLDVNGFNFQPFLKSGHINWNHLAQKDPMAIVGEPTGAKVVNNEFIIEGFLYEDSELAKSIYKAAEMLEKSGSTRKLGFSVEGNATERDPLDKKKIKKATILNVAIAPTPKNAGTSFSLVKAFEYESESSNMGDMILDIESGDERLMMDKSFNLAIIKKGEIVIGNDEFTKSVLMVANAIKTGKVIEGVEAIKKQMASFSQILGGTAWVSRMGN